VRFLQAPLAEIGKLDLDLAAHLAKGVFGDADATGLGNAFDGLSGSGKRGAGLIGCLAADDEPTRYTRSGWANDRSAALCQYERRPRAGYFAERDGRGDHHCALAHPVISATS
jgi:hypothetical protein